MARPKIDRKVYGIPDYLFFKPAGIPVSQLEEVGISIEEVEALRLSDVENMSQTDAAKEMNVSRATYQRVLDNAHKQVADALINGKAIRIEGGNYEFRTCIDRREGQMHEKKQGEKKNMKFGIPGIYGKLCPHFGKSSEFIIIEAEKGNIISKKSVVPSASGCASLPQLLIQNGVEIVLAGGMGAPPRAALENNGIKVVLGVAETDPEKAVLDYLEGNLDATGENSCDHGDEPHHHEGGCCGH